MKKKKKVAFVISSDLFVRNYILTDALHSLQEEFDLTYIVSGEVKSRSQIQSEKIQIYHPDPQEARKHYGLFNVLSWRHRNKSKSFQFRLKRVYGLNFDLPKEFSLLRKTRRIAGTLLSWAKNNLVLRCLGNPLVFPWYFKRAKESLKPNEELRKAIQDVGADLVVFPSSAFDPDGNELLEICSRVGANTLFLIDNWDNLSSKTIMWLHPTHMAVWGEQSKKHGIEIQGVDPERIHLLGTPRFEGYFKTRNAPLQSHFEFPYVLFVGTSLAFDEIGALEILNQTIENNPDLFGNTRIVYRPHPWRLGKDVLQEGALSRVEIDPQVKSSYLAKNNSTNFQPDLNYYPSLLQNAELVIGGLTSMLIEAMIFRKIFLAVVYDDGKNLTSQHNALKWYTHFEGIEEIPTARFCKDKNQLGEMLKGCWMERREIVPDQVDQSRQYFLYSDDTPYRDRLLAICRNALSAKGPWVSGPGGEKVGSNRESGQG